MEIQVTLQNRFYCTCFSQVSGDESEVRESRKIKVKHKEGQTFSEDHVLGRKAQQEQGDRDLSDNENVAEDDLDKILLSKAMCRSPGAQHKRRRRNLDNNNNSSNKGNNVDDKSQSVHNDGDVQNSGTEKSAQNNKIKGNANIKYPNTKSASSDNLTDNTRSNRRTVLECNGPDKVGTPVNNAQTSLRQTDTGSVQSNQTNEDDSEFKSCTSSPRAGSTCSPCTGSGKSGEKKLMSRSPLLFDTRSKLPADIHRAGEPVRIDPQASYRFHWNGFNSIW